MHLRRAMTAGRLVVVGAVLAAVAATAAIAAPEVPTAGLQAGRGDTSIDYFVDLGDRGSASAHLQIVPTVLARLSSGSLGTMSLHPLMMGRDANSTEAACALIAGAEQNRAWVVAYALATARTTAQGDWLGVSTLRRIGRRHGLAVDLFVRKATGRSCYPKLADIRDEARRAKVGSSPVYMVKGSLGTRRVTSPASADEVMVAVGAVS